MDNPANLTQIRDISWIFNALWSYSVDKVGKRCSVNIPATFIFRSGLPFKGICSDELTGSVKRINIDHIVNLTDSSEMSFISNDERKLNDVRKILIEYSKKYAHFIQNNRTNEPFICTVWYTDGECENLSLTAIDILMRNDSWRMQLLLCQSYVPVVNEQKGLYSHKPKVRSRLVSQGAEAADQLTKALAKCAERAYSNTAEDEGSESRGDVNVHVVELQAKFVLDPCDKLVFLNTEYVAIEINGARKEMEEYMEDEKMGREATAAKAVSKELLQLLRHAQKRGLSIQESFSHFDIAKNGFVDAEILIDGLARLGIGVVRAVAVHLLQIIGGIGSHFITVRDFERYVSSSPEAEDTADNELERSVNGNDSINGRSAGSTSKAPKTAKTAKQSRQGVTASKQKRLSSSTSRMSTSNIKKSMTTTETDLPTNNSVQDDSTITSGIQSAVNKKKLPPIAANTITATGGGSRAPPRTLRHHSAVDLPPWSSQRNHRALKELRKSHAHWLTKDRQPVQAWGEAAAAASSATAGDGSPLTVSNELQRETSFDDDSSGQYLSEGDATPSSAIQSSSSRNPFDLSLSSISQEIGNDLKSCLDELLHVDNGVVMTYRVVLGPAASKNGKGASAAEGRSMSATTPPSNITRKDNLKIRLKYLGSEQQNATNNNSKASNEIGSGFNEKENLSSNTTVDAFTLLVVPDLFATVETLHRHFEPLLSKYPKSRLVLVGLPGLPNTHWPRGSTLGPDLYVHCITRLLKYLHENGRLLGNAMDPLFLMGVGSGAFYLSRFVALNLAKLPEVNKSVRALVIVSGFLKITKMLKKIWKDLYESLPLTDSHQMNNLITSLHFWDEYLAKERREEVLERFWKSRRGMCRVGTNDGSGYTGVLEMLKGLQLFREKEEVDCAAKILSSKLPVLFVQGTEDVFVDPRHTAVLNPLQLPPGRITVDLLEDSLRPGALHVSWLKGGHELLQERTSYLLALVNELAQQCGLTAQEEVVEPRDDVDEASTIDKFDMDYLMQLRKEEREKAAKLSAEAAAAAEALAAENSGIQTDNMTDEQSIDESSPPSISQEEEENRKAQQQQQVSEEERRRIEKKRKEKEKRALMLQERRKREKENDRLAILDQMYELQRQENERKLESKERERMGKEDERSMYAEEYLKDCEAATNSAKLAKKKAKELFLARREEAIRRIEEQMARQRLERLDERRRKTEEMLREAERKELAMEGELQGGYDIGSGQDVLRSIAATQRLLKDLYECRQRTADAIKRQKLLQHKTDLTRKQCDAAQNENRRLRRALRVIETNPAIRHMGTADEEIGDIRLDLKRKEEAWQDLQALLQNKEEQMRGINRICALLKQAYSERERLIGEHMRTLQEIEVRLNKSIRDTRLEKELSMSRKDSLKAKLMKMAKRSKQLLEERKRVKTFKTEFVDTDVWIEGVLQRCKTKDLKKYLKQEYESSQLAIEQGEKDAQALREKIMYFNEKQQKMERDGYKVAQAIKLFTRSFEKSHKQSVVEIASELLSLQERAEQIERQVENDIDVDRQTAKLGARTLADKVRLKIAELRTPEEKQFVAIDLIQCPTNYDHLTATEAEEMHFDPGYQCELIKADLDRIEKLPEQIALALPFLYTSKEVEVHRLINKYRRGKDDAFFQSKDFNCYDLQGNIAGEEVDYPGRGGGEDDEDSFVLSNKDIQQADVIHDILLKEARRDRLRALTADDETSEEVVRWLQLDKILSPHVFDPKEILAPLLEVSPAKKPPKKPLAYSVLPEQLEGVPSPYSKPSRTEPEAGESLLDGDKYQELRDRYDADEDLFVPAWKCPFSRSELLEIRRQSLESIDESTAPNAADVKLCRQLMDKYFVDEDESLQGHLRLNALRNLSDELSRAVSISHDYSSSDSAEGAPSVQSEVSVSSEKVSKRVWGSWDQVHPASAGIDSQVQPFLPFSYNAARDHPASFSVSQTVGEGDDEDEDSDISDVLKTSISMPSRSELRRLGEQALTALPSAPGKNAVSTLFDGKISNHPKSRWFIAEDVRELARQDPPRLKKKIVLLMREDSSTLLEVDGVVMQARQSKSLRFDLPDREDLRVLDVTVSIVFQGTFGTRGYRLGRLAAGLFRLPDADDKKAGLLPRPVGYAPYAQQSPNLPESMGRIVLIHRPKVRPIKPGGFQIILGAAASVKLSVQVTCRYAQSALPLVDKLVLEAKQMQARLPICIRELGELNESLKLAERKLLICTSMISEAELETQRCRKSLQLLHEKLDRDDETMEMLEDERREVHREVAILEVEFAQWAKLYGSRSQEKEDIKDGISMMYTLQREKHQEKEDLKKKLGDSRRDLPSCIYVLRSLLEATNVAASLNTSVAAPSVKQSTNHSISTTAQLPKLVTPAENVRKQFRSEGWESLSLEEQQWCIMDQVLRPDLYDWLFEKEEEERLKRLEVGKRVKKKKFNAAVEAYRLTKADIEGILEQPFSMLSRRDMLARKLLSKFHDNPEAMRRKFAEAAYGFDPHLAERVRAKNKLTMSREEQEWISLDKVLHPEVWRFYHHEESAEDHPNNSTVISAAIMSNSIESRDFDKPQETVSINRTHSDIDSVSGSSLTEDRTPIVSSQSSMVMDSSAIKLFQSGSNSNMRNGLLAQNSSTSLDGPSSKFNSGMTGTSSSIGKLTGYRSSQIANVAAGERAHGQQQSMLNKVGALLGITDKVNQIANKQTGKVDINAIVQDAKKDLIDTAKKNVVWDCPFDRETLLKIWRTPKLKLKTEDEKLAFKLMQKFNGSYSAYMESSMARSKRKLNEAKAGSHVRWNAMEDAIVQDVDQRARSVLRTLDQATSNKNQYMDSTVMHGTKQRFPTVVLRIQLEEELYRILREQIMERERAMLKRVDMSDSSSEGSSDDQEEANEANEDNDVDDDRDNGMDDEIAAKISKRAARREKRRRKLKNEDLAAQVHKTRKLVLAKNKTGEALAMANLQNQLGVLGCLACRSNPCSWAPCIDEPKLLARRKEIDAEIDRIRANPLETVFESFVAIGAQLGGGTKYRRADLLEELAFERTELQRRLDLNNVDKELHDVYNTRKEYVEVKHLHGYATVLWTNNARRALEARQRTLVAMNVAQEVVDDILDWMLDGWYFGERESTYAVVGYVPSIKKSGIIKPGQDQIQTNSLVTAKMKKRLELGKSGKLPPEAITGTNLEKAIPIEGASQYKLREDKVAKEGSDHAKVLDETESTLRIGLFMLTIMYFRAMTYLRREQRSWGDDDPSGGNRTGSKKKMTDERRRMLEEERRIELRQKKLDQALAKAKIGEGRRKEREMTERREALLKLQAVVRRQKLEKDSTLTVQRVFRGHLGRKAARRWALKRAELEAMNTLLNAAAMCVQRVWRGYVGRVEAIETRTEMAHFIACMRAEEAAEDETEYWRTHQVARYTRIATQAASSLLRLKTNQMPLGGPAIPEQEKKMEIEDNDSVDEYVNR